MSKDINLALTLSLNDRLIGPLQRALGDTKRVISDGVRELDNVVRSSGRAADALGKLGQKGREAGKVASELRGVATAAQDAERQVGKLQTSLGQLSKLTGKATSLFAGFKAGQAVLSDPRERAQSYELSLAKLSNLLYSDRRTVSGRQAGQTDMDTAIRRATLQGVTREDAVSGLRVVGAAGGIEPKDAMAMLPTLAKFSVAGEASMEDVASLAVKSMKGYSIKPNELPKIMEMALVSGQMGNFEFKDMAKWLPQQMAMSKSMLGMSGVADFGKLLAINQLAVNSAGGNQEAGNNVVNFLGKINSADTQKSFKAAGIDLTGMLAKARGEGVDPIDAFLNLMDGQFAKDKGYSALQGKLQATRASGDKAGEAQTLDAMRGIFAGSVMGKLMPDRQSQMGMVGLLNDRAGLAKLQKDAAGRTGEGDLSQQVLMATSAMKNLFADNAEQARQFDALRGVNAALADQRVKLAELSNKYPEAAKWVETLALAAKSAAAALAVFGLANLATGGKPGALPEAVKGLLSGGTGATAGGVAGGVLATTGVVGGVLAAGAGLTFMAQNMVAQHPEKFEALLENSMLGAMSGDTAFAAAIMSAGAYEDSNYSHEGRNHGDGSQARIDAANRAIDLRIHVTTDSPAFTAEVMQEFSRQAVRQ